VPEAAADVLAPVTGETHASKSSWSGGDSTFPSSSGQLAFIERVPQVAQIGRSVRRWVSDGQ